MFSSYHEKVTAEFTAKTAPPRRSSEARGFLAWAEAIRLGPSLAPAARGSDLPGVITAYILENLMNGYENALGPAEEKEWVDAPEPVSLHQIMRHPAVNHFCPRPHRS